MNNSTAKVKPKMTVKNGVVYGDALSAQEKKRIVMQKKKDRKTKKVRKSAQQTIPYVEMCRDGICKVNSRLYTKSIAFEDIKALPVGELAAKDCALFLWITFPCL